MSDFNDMIQGLRHDSEIPDMVWKRYKQTLENLPEHEGKTVKKSRSWQRFGGAAAAAFAAVMMFCWVNPAFAAEIPIIGTIFEKIQEDGEFSGMYSDKAEAVDKENSVYVAESAGIKLTASEIYSDGISVFLTACLEADHGGLSSITGNLVYLEGSWTVNGTEKVLINNNFEGQIIDDQTFIAMLKLDLEDFDVQQGDLELNLSGIGYDNAHESDGENDKYQIKGAWNLKIPFAVDTEAVYELTVGAEKNGYTIEKVFISPYQVITYTDVPYTEHEITAEEYEQAMSEKTESTAEQPVTYEEYVDLMSKDYEECYTLVFDQDGDVLTSEEETYGHSVNAVQGKDIRKLYIYVFNDFDPWIAMKTEGLGSASAEQAVVSAEMNVK